MDYYQFRFENHPDFNEILIALVGDLPFETFEETENGFNAYLPADQFSSAIELEIEQLRSAYPFRWSKEFLPFQNWNQIWESNFEPLRIGNFCGIRAEFHPPFEDVRFDLVIQPKMAFGTGHHETTRLMIATMQHLDFQGCKVLDYGCGTGVLAILAAKLGAKSVLALDIEQPAIENTVENCLRNDVTTVQAREGTLAAVTETGFDVILANINRNVILNSLPALRQLLKPGGIFLTTGFLTTEADLMQTAAQSNGFVLQKTTAEGDWVCLQFQ